MGLVQIGVVFMVCGLMMLVVQLGAVSRLARRFGEVHLASAALALMGTSLALLALARSTASVFALVAAYGIGMALLTPAVSALVSRRGGAHAGAALGLESSAESLGQIAGPFPSGSRADCSSPSRRFSPGAVDAGTSLQGGARRKASSRSAVRRRDERLSRPAIRATSTANRATTGVAVV
jgi:DHA1 family multidrug resistance protein-like MFS transporter